jgi:hypothetical protein
MMTRLSYPLGKHIPKLEIGFFPWRMLGIATMVAALLAGACAEVVRRMRKTKRRYEAGIAFIVALWIIAGSAWLSFQEIIKPYSKGDPFVPAIEHFNYGLLPRTAYGGIFLLPRVALAELERDSGAVQVEQWTPEHRTLRVELRDRDRLLLRTFNFPGWTATVDNNPVRIESSQILYVRTASGEEAVMRKLDSPGWSPLVAGQPVQVIEQFDLGDIAVPVAAGTHEVRIDLRPTPTRRVGNLTTLAALTLLCAGFAAVMRLKQRERKKHQ